MSGGSGLTEAEIEEMLQRYACLYIGYYIEGEKGDAMCFQVRNNILHWFEKTGLDGKATVLLHSLESEIGLTVDEIEKCQQDSEYMQTFSNALAEKLQSLS